MDERLPKTKITERLLTRTAGATMREIIAATGGPQYNELKRLAARGYAIRKLKEGNETRYFAQAPAMPTFEATMTAKGQVTIPKEVRKRLRVSPGGTLQFLFDGENGVVIGVRRKRLADLAGILGRPRRSATLEEMDEAVRRAVVEKYRRAVR